MHRIAAALPIATAAHAFNGGMPRDTFAGERALKRPMGTAESSQPVAVRSSKLLSLLMILEALRVPPLIENGQKV